MAALAERATGLYVERAFRVRAAAICQAFYGFMADPADPRQLTENARESPRALARRALILQTDCLVHNTGETPFAVLTELRLPPQKTGRASTMKSATFRFS